MIYHLDFVCLVDDLGWTVLQLMDYTLQAIYFSVIFNLDFVGFVDYLWRAIMELLDDLVPVMDKTG